MPNVFGIADDILVIGYDKDGTDHDEAVYKVLKWHQDVNLKLNKEKCHFRCMAIPFFGEVVSRHGVQPDPQKVRALTEMLVPKTKKELQAFLGVINYLNIFSPGTLEVRELLRKLMSSKATWTWNASYQQLFDKAKSLIKVEMCMKSMMTLNHSISRQMHLASAWEQHYYYLGTMQTAQKTLH